MKNNLAKDIVPYNPELPSILIAQHKSLMLKYKKTLEFAQDKQYPQLKQSLDEFSNLIEEHFRSERELYMYLEFVVSKNDGTYRDTRKEMKDIAVTICSLNNLHKNIAVSDDTVENFCKDFSEVGKALLGRMRYEENYLFEEYASSVSK